MTRSVDLTLSGTVGGSAVQAGTVHGGIHLHPHRPLPTPRQLPPAARGFVDRKADLDALTRAYTQAVAEAAPAVIVISGLPGVGKTAAAARGIRALGEHFPDGQLYADLHDHAGHDPVHVLARLLRGLGLHAPADTGEAAALWRSATATLRIGLLLDNASDATQVRPLMMSSPHSLMVITSRRRLDPLAADGATLQPLAPLPPAAARALLTHRLGRRVQDEDSAADQLVRACAGLPLALTVRAARAASRPASPLDTPATEENPVTDALNEATAQLGDDASLLYRAWGLLPTPVRLSADLATAMTQLPTARTHRALDELVTASLLEPGDRLYRMHDEVRAHAANLTTEAPTDADRSALRRAVDYHLAHVAAAERLLCPTRPLRHPNLTWPRELHEPAFPDAATALAWLDEHRLDLMALVTAAAEHAWHTQVTEMVDAMWPLFHQKRHLDLWLSAHRTGLASARTANDPESVRRMLTGGGAGLAAAADYPTAAAWYREARDLAATAGHPRDQGQACLGIAAGGFEDGRPQNAIAPVEEAIQIWQEIGYDRGVAIARILRGEIALAQYHVPEALGLFQAALDTFTDTVHDPFEQARARAFVALGHIHDGRPEHADTLLTESEGYFRAQGSAYWLGRTLEFRALAAHALDEDAQARSHAEAAREAWHGLHLKDNDRVDAWLRELGDTPGQ